MSRPRLTLESFFKDLEGKPFPTYRHILAAVRVKCGQHPNAMPGHLKPEDLITTALKRDWIREGKNGFTVRVWCRPKRKIRPCRIFAAAQPS